MPYFPRLLEARLRGLADHFPVVLVVGARQTGKSTLVGQLFGKAARTFVFDPVIDLHGTKADPEFFLDQHPPPLILDEVQFAPELLGGIKRRVDERPGPGQYILTGSQNLALLRHVSESLAGRAAVVELEPMTAGELAGLGGDVPWLQDWLSDPAGFLATLRPRLPTGSVFRSVWRGGYPGLAEMPDELCGDFFGSYLRTYVERDVRLLGDVRDQHVFGRFLGLCAALTAQEVNHSQLGRELGLTPQTAHRWLALLGGTFLWAEVPPYWGNAIKRLSRRPKGYLVDTGLAAHLQRVGSPAGLEVSPHFGALFETYVVAQIRRMLMTSFPAASLYHWRSHSGPEVDLVVELDGSLWPIEIKAMGLPSRRQEAGFKAFREAYPSARIRDNLLIAATTQVSRLSPQTVVVPWDLA